MGEINILILIWQLCFVVSIISFLVGLIKGSWHLLFLSFVTSLPIAYYFNVVNNSIRLLALTPIMIIFVTFFVYRNSLSK